MRCQALQRDSGRAVPGTLLDSERKDVNPVAVGKLPPQMTAWDLRILNVEAMMFRAVLEHDRSYKEKLYASR